MNVFECKMCGICCEGKGGIVVSPLDVSRLAEYLQASSDEVIRSYTEYRGTKLKLRTGDDGNCIFFSRETGCSVHEGKPDVCRAWPFFRGNLLDKGSFNMAKEFCPGIARDVTFEDFVTYGMRYLTEHALIAQDSRKEANALVL